jgi:hypothetical protein
MPRPDKLHTFTGRWRHALVVVLQYDAVKREKPEPTSEARATRTYVHACLWLYFI